MARVTQEEVQSFAGYLVSDDASQAIAVATLMVDDNLADQGMSSGALKQVELFLACHFMEVSKEKGPLATKTISLATERYHNIYASGLRSTRFGSQAILLDSSGILALLTDKAENPNRRKALFTVVGDPLQNIDPLTLMNLP